MYSLLYLQKNMNCFSQNVISQDTISYVRHVAHNPTEGHLFDSDGVEYDVWNDNILGENTHVYFLGNGNKYTCFVRYNDNKNSDPVYLFAMIYGSMQSTTNPQINMTIIYRSFVYNSLGAELYDNIRNAFKDYVNQDLLVYATSQSSDRINYMHKTDMLTKRFFVYIGENSVVFREYTNYQTFKKGMIVTNESQLQVLECNRKSIVRYFKYDCNDDDIFLCSVSDKIAREATSIPDQFKYAEINSIITQFIDPFALVTYNKT